jgi:hypothetical protein
MYIYKHVNHTGLFDTIRVYFTLRAYAETALEADVPLTHKQTNKQTNNQPSFCYYSYLNFLQKFNSQNN